MKDIKIEIEKKKMELNKLLGNKNKDENKILRLSQELDILINKYHLSINFKKE
ncbi:MAG: aspartyl-phosphate phosphatase Spo0E family protein [Firmicutes bacterium]|nr:aspartyl-phosphate phosphatase Spo0E family protein [Bacillota bacterium]